MMTTLAGRRTLRVPAAIVLLVGGYAPARAAESAPAPPAAGDSFDAARFGWVMDEDANAFGVRWAEPRKIRKVVVQFAGAAQSPAPDAVRLQYWHGGWDGKPEPVASEKGAGGVGWEHMDDWTNGKWKDADSKAQIDAKTWTYAFAPTGEKEFPKSSPGVTYRKTLKVRLLGAGSLPRPVVFQAITDAVYEPMTVRVLFGKPAHAGVRVGDIEAGGLDVFNGAVVSIRPVGDAKVADGRWTLPAQGEGGIETDILRAVDRLNPGFDRTVVTVRSGDRPFSFAADEAARGDRILVDDLGVLVTRGDDAVSLEGLRKARSESAARTVYSRVFDQPEQTLPRAWNDMPLKRPLHYVHGLPGNRNSMHQNAQGDVTLSASKRWFSLPRSPKDSDRKAWAGDFPGFNFGLPNDHHINQRVLRDGYLPILTTWYREGVLSYEQTCVLDKLDGSLDQIGLDDPTVLLMHVRVVNTSNTEDATARLTLSAWSPDQQEKLSIDNGRATSEWEGKPRFRYLLKGSEAGRIEPHGKILSWSLAMAPGRTHDLYFAIPSITLDREAEIAALANRDFEADASRVASHWKAIIDRGCAITTPEPWLNDFYKAHLQHMLVNCFKEIGSDRLHVHVGTFGYGVYPDESVMMISDLDRRGYHEEAKRCYQSLLDHQGMIGMPGNFKSKEGTLYGAGGHEDGGYNKSHAWVMWGLAEHWKYTRDRKWMEQAAPKLVAACEWVIRERATTMVANKDGARPIEYGFLPAGSLEDVTDYWSWLVTNACTDWGFQTLSGALADYGHPGAARLQKESKAFHEDLMRGFEESRILAPVVRLRDSTYVPKYPSRLHERGRTHGWLRETLEGSIHLLITGLVDPRSPQADWILKDFEDNLYISEEYGYAIPAFDVFWFSRGGFSMQANLLGGPLPYLYRDEIKHFLRAYFNGFASAFYPDTRMFNEHSLPELGYPAGDHFKTSDEAQSTYWLRLMFVHERDGDLYLGQAIPRYWLQDGKTVSIERAATHYGQLSLQITSQAAGGQIKATLSRAQSSARPNRIYLRIRQPEGKPMCEVLVDGKPHAQFDAAKEWIVLPGDTTGQCEVIAKY